MPEYFHNGYSTARAAFLQAAGKAGAKLAAHAIRAQGPTGEELSIDTAWLGTDAPQRLLVVSSGTHGVEGPAGTAAQLQFLEEDWPACRLPEDAAVLLLHANNPFGYAWRRRTNEDNVDLNRNFLDWGR